MKKKEKNGIKLFGRDADAIYRANMLNKMAVKFLSQSQESFEAMMTEGVRLIADMVKIDRVSVWHNTSKPDGLHTSQIYRWDNESGGTTTPTPFFEDVLYSNLAPSWENLLGSGKYINGPTDKLPKSEAEMLKSYGVVSLFATPIFINNDFWGFVLFEDRIKKRYFDEDTMEILRSSAFLCANTVMRADMQKNITNIGIFNRATLDAAPVGFTIIDENLQVIDTNLASLELFSCGKDYYIEHFYEFMPEFQPNGDNSLEKTIDVLKRTLKGENFKVEWVHRSAVGDLIPFEITLTRTKYMGKYVALAYQYDLRSLKKITGELKQQSNILKERLEQQELLSEISRSFVSSGESHELIKDAISKLGNYYKVSRVIIYHLDYKSGRADMTYHWTANKTVLESKNIDVHNFTKASFPERLYNNATVPILSCTDTATTNTDDFRELLCDTVKSFICAPLYVEGLVWGFLTVEQCFTPRNWTENEKSFIAMTTSTIAGAIMLDIYNAKLKNAVTKVTAASKAKSEFLSNMSHEMRTPMNAIINMTGIAKNSESLERKNYALDKIEDASIHLLGVINDILDMSKIEAKKFELFPVKFNFEKMIMRVVNVINFRIEEKHQIFNVRIDDKIPINLISDDQRLSQVITNLLGNAVKFTPENGTISLEAQLIEENKSNCVIQISVSDSGIGISKEHQAHLFQSFQQAESSTSRKFGGTGLGLSISKKFVEMMGGEIWVKSDSGEGSTFSFTIKAKRSDDNKTQDKVKTSEKERVNDFSGHRVLLVEDMEINREIVLMLLESTNLEIDCAENGIKAVEIYIKEPDKYEMIFMDVHMPGMDGYEATKQIRQYEEKLNQKAGKEPAHKRTPIIAMTANVFKEDIDHCIKAGMDDHLGKPLDIEMVMEKLRRYLG